MIRRFFAGDRVRFLEPKSEAGELALILSNGTHIITKSGIAGDDAVAFELTSAESAELPAGDYVAFLTVTIDGNRETLSRSTVEVLPNPATASGDLRSSTKRIIDALTEVLEGRASDGVLERSVDGVTLKYASPDTLRRMLESYKMRYAMEQGESILPGAIVTKGVIR